MRTSCSMLLLAALALVASCGTTKDDEEKVPLHVSRPGGTAPAVPLAPGDIRITSTDGGIDLAMIGDSISGGLSAATLAKVRKETDTSAVSGTGFAASLEKVVKGSVQTALNTRIAVPVSAVKDVRYDGQRLVFEWNGKPPADFSHAKVNDKDVMASFSAADAQRFVVAVRARTRALGRQM